MNKERKRKNACGRKRAYANEILAGVALKLLDPERVDATLEVYKCRYCPKWHVGHNDKVVFWNKVTRMK